MVRLGRRARSGGWRGVVPALAAAVIGCGGETATSAQAHGGGSGRGGGAATGGTGSAGAAGADGGAAAGSGGTAGAGGTAGVSGTPGAGGTAGVSGTAGAATGGSGGISLGGAGGGPASCSAYSLECADQGWHCRCGGSEYWCQATRWPATGDEPHATLPPDAPVDGQACALAGWCWTAPIEGGALCECTAGRWRCGALPTGTCPEPLEEGAPCAPISLTCGGGCTTCTCVPGPSGGRLHCLAAPC